MYRKVVNTVPVLKACTSPVYLKYKPVIFLHSHYRGLNKMGSVRYIYIFRLKATEYKLQRVSCT